jgi:hypothetical protein
MGKILIHNYQNDESSEETLLQHFSSAKDNCSQLIYLIPHKNNEFCAEKEHFYKNFPNVSDQGKLCNIYKIVFA